MKCVRISLHDWTSYATVAGSLSSLQAVTEVHNTVLKRESPKQELTPKVLPQTSMYQAAVKDTLFKNTPTRWDFRV